VYGTGGSTPPVLAGFRRAYFRSALHRCGLLNPCRDRERQLWRVGAYARLRTTVQPPVEPSREIGQVFGVVNTERAMRVMFTIFFAALLISGPGFTAEFKDPAGDKAMRDYVLTMAKVKAYEAAEEGLEAATEKDQSLKDESEKMDNEPDKTFADLKAKIARHPRFYTFFSKQGLSQDDVVLIPLTLISACSAAEIPQIAAKMADRVSPQQIAFCKDNKAALQSLKFVSGGGSGTP
jgi:hypothetical protein